MSTPEEAGGGGWEQGAVLSRKRTWSRQVGWGKKASRPSGVSRTGRLTASLHFPFSLPPSSSHCLVPLHIPPSADTEDHLPPGPMAPLPCARPTLLLAETLLQDSHLLKSGTPHPPESAELLKGLRGALTSPSVLQRQSVTFFTFCV